MKKTSKPFESPSCVSGQIFACEERANRFIGSEFGNEVAKRRIALGLSQEKLAELSDMSRLTVLRIENGRQAPNAQTVEKLYRGLAIAEGTQVAVDRQQTTFAFRGLEARVRRLSPVQREQFFEMAEVFLKVLETKGC